ncbi:MAG: hypothetical protein HN341_08695 [Verrucomicrobia bacterium]|nr:hypothetical protein [Verrucomicrobiota bacterium]
MSLRVDARYRGGNVAAVRIVEENNEAEVFFAANPCGAPEALWFDFRVLESDPDAPHPDTITLTLKFVRNMTGCDSPSALHPVYRGEGQSWNRTRSGRLSTDADGQTSVSWTIAYPAPATEFALCYPYGLDEVRTLVRKSKHYWTMGTIGLSQEGRRILRVSSTVDRDTSHPGIYLVARQHAGETPGSWLLDGMLQHFSRTHESRVAVWTVPLADVGGLERGRYGRGGPNDLDQTWGTPPLRYETRAIQTDIAEWQIRTAAALVLNLEAGGGSEHEGIYALLPGGDGADPLARDAEKWANVLSKALGDEYAAEDFKRTREVATVPFGLPLDAYARQSLGISALTLVAPYALCGKTVMTPKQYREAGRRIARAVVQRVLEKGARA